MPTSPPSAIGTKALATSLLVCSYPCLLRSVPLHIMKVSSLCWRYLPGLVYRKHRQPMWSWHLKREISNLGGKEVHRKPLKKRKLTKWSHKPVSSLPEHHLRAQAGAGCPLHPFLMLERQKNCRIEKHNVISQPVDTLRKISSYSTPSQH